LPMNTSDHDALWNARIARARELQEEDAAAATALRFYEATLDFQRQVARRFHPVLNYNMGLRERIDLSRACSEMPGILRLAADHGPEKLRSEAGRLHDAGEATWRELLRRKVFPTDQDLTDPFEDFFPRACLQPIAENLQLQLRIEEEDRRNNCPACNGLPQMAVLHPEGEGASRWLLCSFCLREWPYRRVVCPWCGEEDKEKLPQYSSEEFPHVHVEACDTCKRYLKAIDLSINGLSEPLVDEAALVVLDVWANEHGYTKIVPNLLGF
jgi:FdhE protein